MRNPTTSRHDAGFTLLELLVRDAVLAAKDAEAFCEGLWHGFSWVRLAFPGWLQKRDAGNNPMTPPQLSALNLGKRGYGRVEAAAATLRTGPLRRCTYFAAGVDAASFIRAPTTVEEPPTTGGQSTDPTYTDRLASRRRSQAVPGSYLH